MLQIGCRLLLLQSKLKPEGLDLVLQLPLSQHMLLMLLLIRHQATDGLMSAFEFGPYEICRILELLVLLLLLQNVLLILTALPAQLFAPVNKLQNIRW